MYIVASPTTELSTSIDNSFGFLTTPSIAMPTSRLSLNGTSLDVSHNLNSQLMPRNSLHTSKSNDAIHSHGLATITSKRALQHFNIDEYYVPNDERCHVIGKIRKIPRIHQSNYYQPKQPKKKTTKLSVLES